VFSLLLLFLLRRSPANERGLALHGQAACNEDKSLRRVAWQVHHAALRLGDVAQLQAPLRRASPRGQDGGNAATALGVSDNI